MVLIGIFDDDEVVTDEILLLLAGEVTTGLVISFRFLLSGLIVVPYKTRDHSLRYALPGIKVTQRKKEKLYSISLRQQQEFHKEILG